MHALLRPGILISIGLRNAIKHPITGVFYTAPLGYCLWLHPELIRSEAALWIGATLLFAVYYHACVIVGAQDAWQLVNGDRATPERARSCAPPGGRCLGRFEPAHHPWPVRFHAQHAARSTSKRWPACAR